MSGDSKTWNDRGFFCWIYRVLDTAARANWLPSLIHFRYSDWLSRYQNLKLEWLKICEALRNWTLLDKYFKYQNFLMLSFVIILGMFWRNLTKIGQIYIPYKFAQSGCIRPQIKREILARQYKRFANNSRHARWLSRLQWDDGTS